MRYLIIALAFLCALPSFAQDYYEEQSVDTAKMLSQKGQRHIEKEHRRDQKPHCYCPYQKSTTVWHDIWNDGIVGTTKGVYQSTVKPQAIGEAVGAVQKAANKAPIPAIVAQTGTALAISQIQKSRRHQRNWQPPQAGRACDCDPCPYHGQRYRPAQGIK